MRSFFLKLHVLFVIILMLWLHVDMATAQEDQPTEINYAEGLKQLLNNNAGLLKAEAGLLSFAALQQQAKGAAYPEFSFLAFLAPIFEAKGTPTSVERDYSKWGPIVQGEVTMVWPVFAFGQIESGKRVADLGMKAAQLEKTQTMNGIIFEYKKLYLQQILLKRLEPVLNEATDKVQQALDKANELYATGEGKIKKKDLAQLKIYLTEIRKLNEELKYNTKTAKLAMGHYLGMRKAVSVTDSEFPEIEEDIPALDMMVRSGLEKNPMLQAAELGLKARQSQLKMTEARDLPVLFLGAMASGAYTNMRNDQDSPYARDPYNHLSSAVALGVRWNLNWSESNAEQIKTRGEINKMAALKKEASTGIPLKIAMALWQLQKYENMREFAIKKVKDSTSWSIAEWQSYSAGVGEAKDLLESLAAYYMAQKELAEADFNYTLGWAQLALEIGEQSRLKRFKETQ